MKKIFFALLLILSSCLFMGLKLKLDQLPRKRIPGSSIIYVPSSKYLKYAALGHSSLLADMVYIWAIQYYSDYSISDRFAHLDHIFSIINELDCRYLDPYEIGAIIAVFEAKDVDLALKLLDRGLGKNPNQWIFPFEAGHYAQMLLKDYELARSYYKKTMEIEGAPPIAQRLYADASFKIMDYKTAWENWLEIFQTTDDKRIKQIASNHLYQVKAAQDIKNLQEAIMKFKERYGRNPHRLTELVRSSFLDSIPKDFDGQEYHYNSQTAEISPPSIPWKR